MTPPQSLSMDVVAISDFGYFDTSDGKNVLLSKGSTVNLPIEDCEMMIRRGILKQVDIDADSH